MSSEITGKAVVPDTVMAAPLDNRNGIALQFAAKGVRSDVILLDPAMASTVVQALGSALGGLPAPVRAVPEKLPTLTAQQVTVRPAAGGGGHELVLQVGPGYVAVRLSREQAQALVAGVV